MASFAAGLAEKLNLTPFDVRWRLYLPEAMQYAHVFLVQGGAWCVAPRPSIAAQASRLLASAAEESDTLLEL